jgi:hypothetical protein
MQGIVDSHQKITTNRFSYNRLSTAEVRRQLIAKNG